MESRACGSRFYTFLHLLITLETDVVEKLHGGFGHFLGVLTGNDNPAIAVRHDDITGPDQTATSLDRSIYRFNFIAARAESAAFPFVIGRNLVVDDLIAVRQTAAGDHSQHSQLLPVH